MLVDHLLDKYGKGCDFLLDPYCGSGVSLLQASIAGIAAKGLDINAFALLIAQAKTQHYEFQKLDEEINQVIASLGKARQTSVPIIKNMEFWYTEEAVQGLGKIRYVLQSRKSDYLPFLQIAFAFLARKYSNTKPGEFKRLRSKSKPSEFQRGDIQTEYGTRLKGMAELFKQSPAPKANVELLQHNSEDPILTRRKRDLVLSSPPYGDSPTTVAYGQFSSFGAAWLENINPLEDRYVNVDRESLGRRQTTTITVSDYPELHEVLVQVEAIDPKRAQAVLLFFDGFFRSLSNVVATLAQRCKVCLVVGNRRVRGVEIPMDQITCSFLESLGLTFVENAVRRISSKVMPIRNSPSNRTGSTDKTMSHEYITVFERQ